MICEQRHSCRVSPQSISHFQQRPRAPCRVTARTTGVLTIQDTLVEHIGVRRRLALLFLLRSLHHGFAVARPGFSMVHVWLLSRSRTRSAHQRASLVSLAPVLMTMTRVDALMIIVFWKSIRRELRRSEVDSWRAERVGFFVTSSSSSSDFTLSTHTSVTWPHDS